MSELNLPLHMHVFLWIGWKVNYFSQRTIDEVHTFFISNTFFLFRLNPFMHNVVKWPNILSSIFKVCLTILQHYA